MLPTELVKLTALMQRTSGSPEFRIGLIDGPVFRRASVVPPLLDAEAAYQMLSAMSTRRQTA